MMQYSYLVNNISLSVNASVEEAFSVAKSKLRRLHIGASTLSFSVYKRSVDARRKDDIKFVYTILFSGDFSANENEKILAAGFSPLTDVRPSFAQGNENLTDNIIVVGTGPAGLFTALLLVEMGYPVVLLERGGSVEERKAAVDRFKTQRILDVDTNIQFGAGGAGTFSDGKLVTRINDPLSSFVIDKLVEFGAPPEIRYQARPHIGTDILSVVVDRMLKKIAELGGKVMYNTTLTDIVYQSGKVSSVITNRGAMSCSLVVLAIGHSARDTYEMLMRHNVALEAKAFSVGMRIEHPVGLIDKALYGDFAGNPALGHAEYNLSYNTKVRGVYTFCMCPGGTVVPAASELGGVVVNGMSEYARDGRNSNSAVCCTVFKDDYGATPRAAIEFQRKIERMAFEAAGGDYSAPVCTVGDFLNSRYKNEPSTVIPTYADHIATTIVDPTLYLPNFVVDNIRNGLMSFDKKINGFAMEQAVLTGPETRTSSPIRILRDNDTRIAHNFNNLYPCGEGAGYAGGITSAAIDGVKTAIAIISKYKSTRG